MQSIRHVTLILNPAARQGAEWADEIKKELENCRTTSVKMLTPSREEYTEAILSHAKETDVFAIAGGDGTLNLALEGLILSAKPLLILPLGTANNLARNLKIPNDVPSACRVLQEGQLQWIDVGRVNGLYFLNVAGLGLSTQINRHVDPVAKKRFGVFAYIYFAWKVARRMNPFSVWIETHGIVRKIKALQVSVCNGRYYGSGLIAAEDASISDGILNLIGTQVDRWWKALNLIPALLRGQHKTKEEILSLQSDSFILRTKRPMHLDVDGDIKTKTPARFELLAHQLKVFVPLA